jgi:biopolymer transport protein ExbD
MKTAGIILFVSSFILSCTGTETKEEKETSIPEIVAKQPLQPKDTNHVTVYVRSDGTMLLNSLPASFTELEASFKTLKVKNGTVFYSRANTEQEPPKESIEVVDLVAKYQLPLQFYTDSTFTKIFEF